MNETRVPPFPIKVTPITSRKKALRAFIELVERGIPAAIVREDCAYKRFSVWRGLTESDRERFARNPKLRSRYLRKLRNAPAPEKVEMRYVPCGDDEEGYYGR